MLTPILHTCHLQEHIDFLNAELYELNQRWLKTPKQYRQNRAAIKKEIMHVEETLKEVQKLAESRAINRARDEYLYVKEQEGCNSELLVAQHEILAQRKHDRKRQKELAALSKLNGQIAQLKAEIQQVKDETAAVQALEE